MTKFGSMPAIDRSLHLWCCKAWLTIFICLLFLGSCTVVNAQNRNAGEIKGTIRDQNEAVVPGVSVDARNADTGQVTHGISNDQGVYDLPFVPAGPYSVSFSRDGFEKSTERNITLQVATITVDGHLHVGSVSTEIEVDGSNAVLLQTESAEVNLTLSPESLTQLPNVGGDWKNFTELLPGVAPGRYNTGSASGQAGGAAGGGYYVGINGGEENQGSLLTDGGVTGDLRSGDPWSAEPPLDAIAEVNISTGVFGADTGNGTSSYNIITKSGTNQFHGSAWERVQNTAFEAIPYNQTVQPIFHWNQYGYTIGGPVLKNKLFFFQSLQRNPNSTPVTGFYTVPEDSLRGIGTSNGDAVFDPSVYGIIYDPATQAVVNGVVTRQPFPNNTIPAARFDPVSVNVMQAFPRSNEPYTNGNNFKFASSSPSNLVLWNYRADYDMSNSNRISASGSFDQQTFVNPSPASPTGYFNYTQSEKFAIGQLTDAWTLSPSLLNEARFSVLNQNLTWSTPDTKVDAKLGLKNVPFDVYPHVFIYGGARTPYSVNGDLFAIIRDGSYAGSDSLAWTKGKHSMKFGGEWDRGTDDFAWNQIYSGNFNFNGNSTLNPNINTTTGVASPAGGSGLADFLLGDVDRWNNYVPIVPRLTNWTLQLYAQDSFKLRPNLTVNFGLRALYQTGIKEIHGRFDNFEPTLINPATNTPGAVAFGSVSLGNSIENSRWFYMPRIGASWSPKPNWVVRVGYGLYNVPWTLNNYAGGVGNGYAAFNSATPPTNSFEPVFKFQDPSPNLTFPTNAALTPTLFNGQGVGYLPPNIPITYQDEHQVGVQHVIKGYLIDVAYVGTTTHHHFFLSDYTQIPQSQLGSSTHPLPQYSNVNYNLATGYGNYNSLQVQSKKQYNNGLTYQFTYTYAHKLDTGTGTGAIGAGQEIYQNAYSPSENYGPAANDIRHMFNGSVVYELPFGKGKAFLNSGTLLDEVVGGWQVSTAFQSHTGTPITPTVASEPFVNSGLYSGSAWYTNRTGSGRSSHHSLAQYYNVNDFAVPANNTLGNGHRDSVFGPGFTDIDLSAGKKFRIPKLGERASFEFKVDAFNALNHPNWGQPNGNIYGTPALNATNGAGAIGSFGPMRNLQLEGHFRF